ncbi:hypothetical protein JCM10212_001353 [Sporobolomyces blumeae]
MRRKPLVPPLSSSSSSSEPTRPFPRSKRRDRHASSPSSTSSSDSDFGSRLRAQVREEARAIKEQEDERRRKVEVKRLRDNGEAVPPQLLRKGKGNARAVESEDSDAILGARMVRGPGQREQGKERKPEERAIMEGLVPGRGANPPIVRDGALFMRPLDDDDERSARSGRRKGKGKATGWDAREDGRDATSLRDTDLSEVPTKASFDWEWKKKEHEKRNKIKIDCDDPPVRASPQPSTSAASLARPVASSSADAFILATKHYTEKDLLKHLGRRWIRNKKEPLVMDAERSNLEQWMNPLVRLLDVKITIMDDEPTFRASSSSSDPDSEPDEASPDEDWTPQTEKRKKRVKKRGQAGPDQRVLKYGTDDSDSAGTNSHRRRHRSASLRTAYVDDDGDDGEGTGDGTDWGTDGMEGVSKSWPVRTFSSRPLEHLDSDDLSSRSEDRAKTSDGKRFETIVISDNEPATADEADCLGAVGTRATSVSSTVVKIEHDSDNDAEPDTEPSDLEPTPSFDATPQDPSSSFVTTQPIGSQALRRADELAKEVEVVEEKLRRKAESHSQSRSSQGPSQPFAGSSSAASTTAIETEAGAALVGLDPEDSEDDEIDEQALRLLRQSQAVASKREARAERQQADLARARREREQEERRMMEETEQINWEEREESQLRDRERNDEEETNDGGDEELAAWEVSTPAPAKAITFPYQVKKGRPKFKILSREQYRIGPHPLPFAVLSAEASQPPVTATFDIPASINKHLRPYQREGAEFLMRQVAKGMGGILGDDMGLGKTIQVIAFLSAIMRKTGFSKTDSNRRKNAINSLAGGAVVHRASDLGPTCLIACPTSVLRNWEREFHVWGYFDVAIYSGTAEQRARAIERFSRGYVDVLIVGLEAARDHIDEFARLDISLVIVDEAHRLKSPKSRLTRAFHQFPTPFRYGLTGTAIQNNLEELWCLLTFANPGHVGTLGQWTDLVSRPLKYAQRKEATVDEIALGRSRAVALVTNVLPHFWLRRTKESVKLQLPRKRDNVVLCPLTTLQKDVYRRILDLEDVKIMLTADDPCPCGARDEQGLPYKRGSCCEQGWTKLIFRYITLFQKISNHLALIYPDRSDIRDNPDKYKQDVIWAKEAFPDDYEKRKPGQTAFSDPDLCGKWKVLCELLEMWAESGDKVLIFSMSLKVLDLLTDLMETTRYKYLVLDGKTQAAERMDRVDAFNDPDSDIFAFLISTRAGGVGLNLKAANKVVIFDPNWNPSHDLQAMDRSHRFGQTKEVDVYRLIGAGTLEELILNRQQYKRAQAGIGYDATAERRLYSGVQGEGKENAGELWGVKNIFRFAEHLSLTEKAIREMKLDELEYARSAGLSVDVDDKLPELPDYEDDENADDVVAAVTGIRKKVLNTSKLSPAEIAKLKQQELEREKIALILGGRVTIQSDATLGGSRIEELRTREALQAKAGSRSKKRTTSVVPFERATSAVKIEPSAAYDPMSRGKRKRIKTEGLA